MANGAGNVLVGPLLNGKKTRIEVLIGSRNQIDSTERASLVAERCGVKFAAKNDRWTFASAVTLALRRYQTARRVSPLSKSSLFSRGSAEVHARARSGVVQN
jgi:hypothetical protein